MITELLELLSAWETTCGDPSFLSQFDFNSNCRIDTSDLLHFLSEYAQDAVVNIKEKLPFTK